MHLPKRIERLRQNGYFGDPAQTDDKLRANGFLVRENFEIPQALFMDSSHATLLATAGLYSENPRYNALEGNPTWSFTFLQLAEYCVVLHNVSDDDDDPEDSDDFIVGVADNADKIWQIIPKLKEYIEAGQLPPSQVLLDEDEGDEDEGDEDDKDDDRDDAHKIMGG